MIFHSHFFFFLPCVFCFWFVQYFYFAFWSPAVYSDVIIADDKLLFDTHVKSRRISFQFRILTFFKCLHFSFILCVFFSCFVLLVSIYEHYTSSFITLKHILNHAASLQCNRLQKKMSWFFIFHFFGF